jgi:carbamate kinase
MPCLQIPTALGVHTVGSSRMASAAAATGAAAAHQRVVVTVGGNALVRPGEDGSFEQQLQRAQELAGALTGLPKGSQLVLTHGNGPQVGQLILQNESLLQEGLGRDSVPPGLLSQAGAATQGQMGLMLQQALGNATGWPTATVLTQVVVDETDPAFQAPTKYIGSFYTEAEAAQRARRYGWIVRQDSSRGWRRVVPSPSPLEVVEAAGVAALLNAGFAVVACGGGGAPTSRGADGLLRPVEAVVDKDASTVLLAAALGVHTLYSLTGVDEVQTGFGTPQATPLRQTTAAELERLLAVGEFPEGSMGPKVRAALDFLHTGGAEVVITSPELLGEALAGRRGTRVKS